MKEVWKTFMFKPMPELGWVPVYILIDGEILSSCRVSDEVEKELIEYYKANFKGLIAKENILNENICILYLIH